MNEQLKQLDEIRARYEAATPGPYTVCSSKYGTYLKDANGYPFLSIANNPKTGVNTDFIICSLNTVPKIREALAVAIEGLDMLKLLCESTEPDEDDLHKDLTGWDLYEYILGYQNQIQKILEDKGGQSMNLDEIRQRLEVNKERYAPELRPDNLELRESVFADDIEQFMQDIAYLLSMLEWRPIENHWEDRLEQPTMFRRADGSTEYAPEGVSFFDFNEDEGPFVSFRTLPKGGAL